MRFSIKVKIGGLLRFLSLMRIGKIFEVLKKILKSTIHAILMSLLNPTTRFKKFKTIYRLLLPKETKFFFLLRAALNFHPPCEFPYCKGEWSIQTKRKMTGVGYGRRVEYRFFWGKEGQGGNYLFLSSITPKGPARTGEKSDANGERDGK